MWIGLKGKRGKIQDWDRTKAMGSEGHVRVQQGNSTVCNGAMCNGGALGDDKWVGRLH